MQIASFTEPFRHWVVEDLVPAGVRPARPPRAEPFRHWVVDALVPAGVLPAGPPPGAGWVYYDNDCERRKRACNDPVMMGPEWRRLFAWLTTPGMVGLLADLSGVRGLVPDPTLHGGGVHVTDPGGWLAPHLDYALHPKLSPPMERRLNLVLFLNREWREEWGGALDLCADDGATVVKSVCPAYNRAVLWEPGDLAYHATARVADDAPPRITAAVYYLAPARPTAVRKRALFCPYRI